TYSCEGEDYTLRSGATVKMSLGVQNTTAFTFALDLNGTMAGGGFGDNTSVKCTFGFTIDASKLSAEEQVQVDCSNATFGCTVGEETLSCEDLKEELQSGGPSCSV
ncbi:MAG: hypothetical protein KGQ59_10815, partial [Bdellovibrionales bacterium]|nr:hypothetical protein [Bdellovibrionales bacterium]